MAKSRSSNPWIRYANQGAVRNRPVDEKLVRAMSFLPELGIEMEVFSGGQPAKGSGLARVGSTRHDHGNAADVFFYKNGRKLDWSKPGDREVFKQIVSRARARGVTGFGAGPGYMQKGAMHIGFGKPAVWGAGGKGANAPEWLREAFHHPNDGHDHGQTASVQPSRTSGPQQLDPSDWRLRGTSRPSQPAPQPAQPQNALGPVIVHTTNQNALGRPPAQRVTNDGPLPAHTLAELERYRSNPGPSPGGVVMGNDRPNALGRGPRGWY